MKKSETVGDLIDKARIYQETKEKLKKEKEKERKKKRDKLKKELKQKSSINLKKARQGIRIPKARYQGIPVGRNIY